MRDRLHFTSDEIESTRRYAIDTPPPDLDPQTRVLVNELIARATNKWTMALLDILTEHGELRFTPIRELTDGISYKMLIQTLRHMERDGLLVRTVHVIFPPKVEYRLTLLGLSLGGAFCGVKVWAAENLDQVEGARQAYSDKVWPG